MWQVQFCLPFLYAGFSLFWHSAYLELLQRHILLSNLLRDEVAVRLDASRVVFHVQCDRAPGLGATSNVIELKSHQSLDQSCKTI